MAISPHPDPAAVRAWLAGDDDGDIDGRALVSVLKALRTDPDWRVQPSLAPPSGTSCSSTGPPTPTSPSASPPSRGAAEPCGARSSNARSGRGSANDHGLLRGRTDGKPQVYW